MSTLRPEHTRRFRMLATRLNELRDDVAGYLPDVNYYLDGSGTLHLMSGRPHDAQGVAPLHENSLDSIRLAHASGGDW